MDKIVAGVSKSTPNSEDAAELGTHRVANAPTAATPATLIANISRLVAHAKRRRPVMLIDGDTVTLLGIKQAGTKARVEYPGGRKRTIPAADIAHLVTR